MPVLVTTEHRGVFFGFIDPAHKSNKTLTLQRCRNCISWSASVKGFLGLAATGPDAGCRIGAVAPEVILHGITSVSDVTEAAAEAWVKA